MAPAPTKPGKGRGGYGGQGDRRPGRHPGVDIEQAPVGSLLLQVVRAHARVATGMLQRIGLVPPQEVVLLYVGGHGACPQAEIVRFMGRDRSTVTKTLQALERAGLIERRRASSDGRALEVSLTAKGRGTLPSIRATWAELEARTTAGLTGAQRAALIELLTVVRESLNAALDAGETAQGPRRGS